MSRDSNNNAEKRKVLVDGVIGSLLYGQTNVRFAGWAAICWTGGLSTEGT
jgi:hypothetical protein